MGAITRSPLPSVGRSLRGNFTGLWCIVFALLPVAATEFGLVPIYGAQRRLLPAGATFFCFLGFTYVFSLRHSFARAMFGARLPRGAETWRRAVRRVSVDHLPAGLILASLGAAATYLAAFESGRGQPTFPALPRDSADAVVLALSFVGMFLLAEAAFAIMAVREYLQDVLGLSDAVVIAGVPRNVNGLAEPQTESLTFSYSLVPGAANEPVMSQFDSELDAEVFRGQEGSRGHRALGSAATEKAGRVAAGEGGGVPRK